jgi:hypothetical protein
MNSPKRVTSSALRAAPAEAEEEEEEEEDEDDDDAAAAAAAAVFCTEKHGIETDGKINLHSSCFWMQQDNRGESIVPRGAIVCACVVV